VTTLSPPSAQEASIDSAPAGFDDLTMPALLPSWKARVTLLAVAIAVALIAALVAAVSTPTTPGSGPLTLVATGRAVVESPAGDSVFIEHGDRRIQWGSTIEILEGSATVDLAGAGVLELRAGFASAADSRVTLADDLIDVVAGEVLALGAVPTIGAGPATVEMIDLTDAATAARVGRGLAARVGVYQGHARVSSANRLVEVGTLEEVTIASARLVPVSAVPIQVDGGDPWDRRFLGEAIDLDAVLGAQSLGITAQLGSRLASGDLVAKALPLVTSQPGYSAGLIAPTRTPGEAVVGAVIAIHAQEGTFIERWERTFSFRDAGAGWGVVVAHGRADPATVLADVAAAIDRAGLQPIADAPGTGPTGPVPTSPPVLNPPSEPTEPTEPIEPTEPTEPPPPEEDPIDSLLDGLIDPLMPDGDDGGTAPLPEDPDEDGGGLGSVVDGVVETTFDILGGLLGG